MMMLVNIVQTAAPNLGKGYDVRCLFKSVYFENSTKYIPISK